jgi:2-oxo-3-hexenedioate decarboxylase
MTPEDLLRHIDSGALWACVPSREEGLDVAQAYQRALAVRALRIARGEKPLGYKIGFTNRTIWERYGVYAPIWGSVWDSTLTYCEGRGRIALAGTCQPRLEPEAVFGLRKTPAVDATLEQLFEAIEWIAPGFEVVQSHLQDWKFAAADTVLDSGLHARLLVGARRPVQDIARSGASLDAALAHTEVELRRDGVLLESGRGANVLDGPLHALLHFLRELRQCPNAPDLRPGDVVTTGTWTDAWPIVPGDQLTAQFSEILSSLAVDLV